MISPARDEEYPMDSSPKAVLFPEVGDRCPSITTDIEICQCQMTRKNDIARTCIWNLYLPSKVNDCSTSITVNMDICQRHVTRNDVTKTLGKEVPYGLLSKRYAWCTDLTLAYPKLETSKFQSQSREISQYSEETPVLESCRPASLLKRDSNTSVFLRILWNFSKHLFWKTFANGCFWSI